MNLNNKSKRRKELIEIAAEMFCREGYERTTVRMLAEAMGIKSGSLFHHFNDKQEMLCAVIESGMTHALDVAEKALLQSHSPRDRLTALAQAHLTTLLDDRNAHVVAIYEWRSLSEPSRAHLINLRDRYEALWRAEIEACLAAGLLRGEPSLLRHLALGALNWTVQWYDAQGEKSPESLAEGLIQLMLGEAVVGLHA